MPTDMSASSQTLNADALAALPEAISDLVSPGAAPGLVTALAQRGEIVHLHASGYARLEDHKRMAPDTIFRLFSLTKPVTAAAAMILYEDGRFGLDDEVGHYLPEFREQRVIEGDRLVPVRSPMTIRHLLTHTSGLLYSSLQADPHRAALFDGISNEAFSAHSGMTLAEHVADLTRYPLDCQPGTAWRYGESSSVLARLVERVSGTRFGVFLREYLLQPLGMKDTAFYVPMEQAERVASLYIHSSIGCQPVSGPLAIDPTTPPSIEAGGSGLFSTARDYLRFCQMLLNGGELDGKRILSRATVSLMLRDHLPSTLGERPLESLPDPMAQGRGLGFGFGARILKDPDANESLGSVGEYSWSGWANTHFWIDPVKEVIGLAFAQLLPGELPPVPVRARMQELTYGPFLKD